MKAWLWGTLHGLWVCGIAQDINVNLPLVLGLRTYSRSPPLRQGPQKKSRATWSQNPFTYHSAEIGWTNLCLVTNTGQA